MEDTNDEIELCQKVGPNLVETVKSKAVIKFSHVQVPANFNRLKCNTNLNLPPSNWLTTSSSSHGLHQALYQNAGFASFRLGQMFPDCVGGVDVVSDAENIKKLLKLPYTSKCSISMIVHKVGNTLLLDEFDIQKYLLRKADDDWKWLRTFILEHVLAYDEKGQNYCLKDKSREALQTKNLLSKFLYYSLKQSGNEEASDELAASANKPTTAKLPSPVLPEAKEEVYVPDPKSSHAFNRNVVWTFEDIRMLIGTNFPIFGGKTRPCVSLRLRDMNKPISVLTGIDYWLDNLMCNVPEVVMCYHLDGIVQKYEIIKTEDLPHLEDSKFSPQVVRNVAQNILSFLKAKATKSGHTYWLFKGRNDDVVKLYDLTTLCKSQNGSDDEEQKQANPFTVPVGMLLYTVARNMKKTVEHVTPRTAGSIRALLDNCINLLPKEKYPQIVASSHYILSDLHVPAGIDPKAPRFDEVDSDEQSVYDDEEEPEPEEFDDSYLYEQSAGEGNFAMQQICDTLKGFKSNMKQSKPLPLIASTEERCNASLRHISAGISCLQYFNENQEEQFIKESEERAKDEERQHILHEERNPNMAKPFNAIPLPYETLQPKQATKAAEIPDEIRLTSKQKKAKRRNKKKKQQEAAPVAPPANVTPNNQQLSATFNSQHFGSWNVHLKLLLLEKACLTYATWAEHNYEAKRFGSSLRAIAMSYRCQEVVSKYMSSIKSLRSYLLGRAGDCFYQISKNWDSIDEFIQEYEFEDEQESVIRQELEKELHATNASDKAIYNKLTKDLEVTMITSCQCYEDALEHGRDGDVEEGKEMLRRLGNVRNELGIKFMDWSQQEFAKTFSEDDMDQGHSPIVKKTEPAYARLVFNSFECLGRAIEAFSAVKDNVNLAFLYCNMGRLMRLRAHLILPNERWCWATLENQRKFYEEAFSYYAKANSVLEGRDSNADLWDLVNWELSTAMFTLAKQLQDFTIARKSNFVDVSKDVLEQLMRSLRFCDVENKGSRRILYLLRSGHIHKRIASLYYSQLRASRADDINVPKTTFQLCTYHYEKASSILDSLNESYEYLVVQLERISLQEFLAESTASPAGKVKHMQGAFKICLETQKLFDYVVEKTKARKLKEMSNENNTNKNTNNNINNNTNNNTNNNANTVNKITDNGDILQNLLLFESRLQNALKTLTKLLLTGKDPKKLSGLYKKMYLETLNGKRTLGAQQRVTREVQTQLLANLLKRLNCLNKSIDNNGAD